MATLLRDKMISAEAQSRIEELRAALDAALNRIDALEGTSSNHETRLLQLEDAATKPYKAKEPEWWTAKRMCKEAGYSSNPEAAVLIKMFASQYSKAHNLPTYKGEEGATKKWVAFTEEAARHAIAKAKDFLG